MAKILRHNKYYNIFNNYWSGCLWLMNSKTDVNGGSVWKRCCTNHNLPTQLVGKMVWNVLIVDMLIMWGRTIRMYMVRRYTLILKQGGKSSHLKIWPGGKQDGKLFNSISSCVRIQVKLIDQWLAWHPYGPFKIEWSFN